MESSEIVLPDGYPREGVPTAPHAYYVYFIYCAGRVKIGRAMDVKARLKNIAVGSPFRPTVLLAVSGSLSAEKVLHARFAQDRTHGEWFRLSDHLRRYLIPRMSADAVGAFRRAEEEFIESVRPEPEEPGPRKWQRPLKRCHHRVPLTRSCRKCSKETALRVYEELVRRIGE